MNGAYSQCMAQCDAEVRAALTLNLGIACNYFLYVFVNLAMVMGAIPVGGVPLPLISHGGSAMLTVMLGVGVLMSVHVHRDVAFAGSHDDRSS